MLLDRGNKARIEEYINDLENRIEKALNKHGDTIKNLPKPSTEKEDDCAYPGQLRIEAARYAIYFHNDYPYENINILEDYIWHQQNIIEKLLKALDTANGQGFGV